MNKRNVFTPLALCAMIAGSAPCRAVSDFQTRDETLAWSESARFGIFVHWDPRVAVEMDSFDPDVRPETKRAQDEAMFGRLPDGRFKWQAWNPTAFDAREWIDIFVAAGAKYFTFTTMHAYGFCNFDSPATDFNIMKTPFHRDVVEELAQAAKGRITAFWYYNCADGEDGAHIPKELQDTYRKMWRVDSYDELRRANIYHLITNMDRYGKVGGIWWDGGGKFHDVPANEGFLEGLRKAQPWIIMNPRCGAKGHVPDWRGKEQRMEDFSLDPQWEMCVPMESSIWFYAEGLERNTKDFEHCLKLLLMCAARDGNLLLNVSPMPDGRIQPLQEDILRAMGQWLGEVRGKRLRHARRSLQAGTVGRGDETWRQNLSPHPAGTR